ncbi:MAG: hypothetical protein KF760_09715 [Candidatus Eremiobacteraeota bacterium]|nr:hypothetical protein [Candidatus Eremiobacteraeota bacterium]MCW5866306.1 hypothetical protein [Candidatus Eremiobacteraeota bacterium]
MMNIRHLRADGYEGIYFEDEDGNTLGIERADAFDEQDVAAGMNAYCVVLGTGQSVYGGIDHWRIDRPGHALLVLTQVAADELGTEFDAFEIDADPAKLATADLIVQRLIAD